MKQHVARKRFGQNFLIDNQVIGSIIFALLPKYDDCVVEIGPGLGALTKPLLENLHRLTVVEIDRDIVARLKKEFPEDKLAIHEADALTFDFGSLAAASSKKLRLIGNLPYNISTPLLFHLAGFAQDVDDMHFMLQKEVVERMLAEPGNADYGRLSVMLKYRFVMDWMLDVPPEAFNPAPKVDSAVVRLIPKPLLMLNAKDEAFFSKLVSAAFSQRRKMLRNTLKDIATQAQLVSHGISPTARAEELSLEDYVRLANGLGSA